MSVSIKLKGVKGLARAFRNASGLVSDKIDKAIQRNAADMVGTAQALAPVDDGELRNSIGSAKIENGYRVEATAPHAGFVEWGTRKMAAKPYFFVSYRLNKKRFRSRTRRAVRAAIKEAGLSQ